MKLTTITLLASVALTLAVIHATPTHNQEQKTLPEVDDGDESSCQPMPRHLSSSPRVAGRPGSITEELLFESLGRVYICKEGDPWFIRKRTISKDDVMDMKREYTLNQRAYETCPDSVIRPYDFAMDADGASFKMDYARGGDIFELALDLSELAANHPNTDPLIVKALQSAYHDMAQSLHCLKSIGMIHADIKTDNFVISLPSEFKTRPPVKKLVELLAARKARVLLIDFGASFYTSEEKSADLFWGTQAFVAREIFHRQYFPIQQRHLSEVASLGMTYLYTIYNPPVQFDTVATVTKYRSCNKDIPDLEVLQRSSAIQVPDTLYDLLNGMVRVDLDQRLTIEQVLDHDFFKGAASVQK